MRTLTLKGLFLTAVFMVLGCLAIHAADDDLITRQITVKLDEAGTLPDKIGVTKKYKLTNLKIVGEINGTDLCFIRAMAGRNVNGNGTAGKLAILDLSEAKIVKGGDYYYYNTHYTSDDVIGEYAFQGCSGLAIVTLPSSVTSIGRYAFQGCSGLASVTLPSSVTSIGWYAFEGCSGLASVTLPSSVTYIGGYAFSGCSGLTSVTLPSSVTSIDGRAFSGCSGLTSVTISSSVTSIVRYAFEGCENLKECNCLLASDLETYLGSSHDDWEDIPVDKIKYYLNEQELTKLEIPSGVNKIGGFSFYRAKNLSSVTIPSSVTYIGDYAFSGCSGLTSVAIPSSVTSIGDYAFSGCSGLTSVTLPSSVTSIGSSAFRGCSGLTSVYVSWKSPLSINASVFENANTKKCILYVPKGTYDDYWLSNWGVFDNIEECDVTGIDNVTTSSDVKEISRYSVNGQRLKVPTKGLNIVKYSDGSVKKVVVQ
ncbi:MAG: leucine-rich repeat domain-containing protein [Prevotella sp.]|nr:leucine-rich repeat domain-containing protein [Prevotella sp.]